MENTEVSKDFELQEMRDQIALLNQKLDRETLISDQLLHDTMMHKIHYINANAWISSIAFAVVILMALLFFPLLGISKYFSAFTVLMMLVCVFFTFRYHKNVNGNLLNGDLATAVRVMKKLKQDYANWMKYAVVMVAVWFSWFLIEMALQLDSWPQRIGLCISALVGLVAGGFAGIKTNKSVIGKADEIVKLLENE